MDLKKNIARHIIGFILTVKVFAIFYILTDHDFFFGEKPVSAQEEKSAKELSKEEKTDSQNAPAVSNRRSYIDQLLHLPEIDKDGLQKNEISRFLILLDKKIQQVKGRTEILNKREVHLKNLETSIEGKLENLDEEMGFFKQTLQKEKDINDKRLDGLVKFYEKMTPKKAAPIFEKMDKDLVVALFKRIPKKQTMNILSLMAPDRSVELTEYFGRIRSGKEYEMLRQINTSLVKEFQECKGLPKDAS